MAITKHIKKKFQIEFKIDKETEKGINEKFEVVPWSEAKNRKAKKGEMCLLHTETNVVIAAFPYNTPDGNRFIPEPDPVLVYFNSAYFSFKEIEPSKTKVLELLIQDTLTEGIINELYKYFHHTNGFVIFLFTSIEAFINRLIKPDYQFKISTKKRTEVYNKEQIERYLAFDVKITDILKDATGKDFAKQYPLKYIHIKQLKEFRDKLVHTKVGVDGFTAYDYLYKQALNFKYEDTINAVADFFNFHKPEYIESCPCSTPI
jgi:hypothetical protein